jgi:acyl-homoserine-lactone acylase
MLLSCRTVAALACLSLVPALATAQVLSGPEPAVAADTTARSLLRPADGVHRAVIRRTEHGIAHVVADDYASLGFGHGYATAETSICTLADTLLTARGERSRWFGPDERYSDQVTLFATNLQTDTLFTDLRNRRVVERLLADPQRGPSRQAKALVRGYVAGVNDYLRSIGGAENIADPACRGAGWVRPTATAKDLWYGVYAANLLASTGVFVPQVVDAAPPTPDGPGLLPSSARYAPVPEPLPARDDLLAGLGKDPQAPFGSNATALGGDVTTTGRGMVLGNPHFPWRGRYRFTQAHLTIPGEYDVAGASLIGSPVVNIGWNKDVAWSHTVSTAYRFTPYEYRTVPGAPTTYLTTEGPKQLERRAVEVTTRGEDGELRTITEDLYRTHEGYVLDAPDVLMAWSPVSFFALRDANAEHLRTIDTFHEMARATNVRTLLAAQDRGAGMPWVNTIAADRSGTTLYADHSVVPNVPDELVNRCLTPVGAVLFQLAGLPALDGTRASGECAWRDDADAQRPGIFGPGNLPTTYREDWVVNANDSHWLPNPEERLEGFARIIGCERCERTLRTRMVYRYVMDRLAATDGLGAGSTVSQRQLKAFEHENRVFGAEVAREGDDLQDVCEAAAGGRACEKLASWDGRSDADSVGAHIFREFWRRVPDAGLWQVPFDPDDPVATPRDLNELNPQVVQAMRDALAYLREEGVPYDAPLGTLQVAGDEGAPPIPTGGGEGFTGNANAVSSRDAAANLDRLYPISYGSSHIQAVAFRDDGRLDAATILSYGQAVDPTSPFSDDQTRMFSQERWVRFPWTEKEIRDALLRRYVVSDVR